MHAKHVHGMAKALNVRIGNQAYLMQEVRESATVFDDFFAKVKQRWCLICLP